MAPSVTKSAGIFLLAALPSLGKAASQTCTLKDLALASSICGPTGAITNFDYFVEDLYDAEFTSVVSCASQCAGRSNCKSFNIRTQERESPFCELHTGTQRQVGFMPENDPENTASSYQGFDLSCFTCVDSNSTAGAQSTSGDEGASSIASSSSTVGAGFQVSSSRETSESRTASSGSQSSISQGISTSSTASYVSQSSASQVFSSSGIASSATSVVALASSSSTSPALPTTPPFICNEDNCYHAQLSASELMAIAMPVHKAHEKVKAIAMPMHTAHEEVGPMPTYAEPLRAPQPAITSPVSLVTITMTDKSTTRTITAPIDDLPPPSCGLKLSAFIYPEEAYWAHCPDYTSSTTVTPEPTPAITSSASIVTVTVTDKGTNRTITDSVDKLPPPPCGLKLSAFMYPEEEYWAHCPDYTSSTTVTPTATSSVSMVTVTISEETTTRTITTTWNSAFDYQEEALWTYPPGNGDSWSLPPPSTHTPTGLERPAGPDWWKEPAFTSSTNADG
ncbi:hypothetical protein ACEPPN_001905 [Leptodophora sp. 'Broadleaf-Isolate-01']